MIFFIVVIIVFSLMYGYIGWRLIVPAEFSLPVNIILWAIIVIALILPFLPIMMRFRGVGGFWIDALAWIGYLSFGFMTLLFAFLVAKDMVGTYKTYKVDINGRTSLFIAKERVYGWWTVEVVIADAVVAGILV